MNNSILAIIGILGGIICAISDLFLDLKGPDNKKLGKMKIIDSKWEHMPHYRFVVSTILALFAVPMYCCAIIALTNTVASTAPVYASSLKVIFLIGAMGGFMLHTFVNMCPTIYQIIIKKADFELADEVIGKVFRQIYVPFFGCYVLLVIAPSIMIVYGIITGIITAPLWCICLNPVVFQIAGLLLRATKLHCFIDAPSCCAASLGLASYGVLALIVM